VRRRLPDVLYQMWFYVSVPGYFETPRVYTAVRPAGQGQGQGGLDVAAGQFTYDEFLTVQYDSKLQLQDELVITGRLNSSDGRWSHALSDVTARDVITGVDEGVVHELSDGVYVTSVKFDEPFAYSTSSWVRGKHQLAVTSCHSVNVIGLHTTHSNGDGGRLIGMHVI